MPYKSEAQRRYIYSQAAAGVAWARKFISDSGDTPPPVRGSAKRLAAKLRKR